MNFIEFIRLVRRHLLLLIIVPIFMAVATYFFVRNSDHEFTSSTMLYTGLSTGISIENTGEVKKDQFVVNNSFENILNTIRSRETMREVSFRLLAKALVLTKADGKTINPKTFDELQKWVSADVRKAVVVPHNAAATYDRLTMAYKNGSPREIQWLFNEEKTPFSLKKLNEIKAIRKGNSDMIEISYTLNDKGLCENTIQYTLEVFMKKYKGLKVSETGNVVEYFQEQLANAKSDLNLAEDRMKSFRENGQILNYYEQTKALANKKEDITDEQSRLVGELDAADNALKKLEQKLAINREAFFRNTELLRQKDKIAELTATIAQNSLDPTSVDMQTLDYQVKNYERQLTTGVRNLYERTHSTENVQIKSLLESWLENMILVEKNKARVQVLDKRMGEIRKEYARFAPLGSGLSRLEREIDVHERAYIQILHDLNMALLRKQSIELSSNLDIMDSPMTTELPSKKIILIVLAGLIGFMGVLATIILLEVTDQTIKTMDRATLLTGLNAAGAMPVLVQNSAFQQRMSETLIGQIVTNFKLKISSLAHQKTTPLILIASTQPNEGKSFLSEKITEHLEKAGARVLLIQPTDDMRTSYHEGHLRYPANKALSEIKGIHELISSWIDPNEYDYCLLELPALLSGNIPTYLLRNAHLSLLAVSANRSWKKADKKAVNVLETYNIPVEMIVNGVSWESLENQVAEKEISDPKFKQVFKRLIRFEFNRKELIKPQWA